MMNSEENVADQVKSVEENSNTDKVLRYAHKVTIDNFSDHIEDEFWSDALFEADTYFTKQFSEYLQLSVNKIDQVQKGNLLVLVNFRLFEKTVSKFKYKLWILDGDGRCQFEKVECNEVDEVGKYVWKCEVDSKCLLYDDKMIKCGEVIVYCEITITQKTDGKSKYTEIENQNILKINWDEDDKNGNIRIMEDILSAKPRVIDSLSHKWTINNFKNFYLNEWTIDEIESNKFYSCSNKEHKFQLSLFPNGDRDEYRDNISIYLFHTSQDKVDVNVRCKISIIDEMGDKFNTRGFEYKFSEKQTEGIGFGEYMSVSNLNELVQNDKIILFCEVIADINGQIGDNMATTVELSESNFNAQPQVIDSLVHKWTFENFGCFYRDELIIDYIASDKFHSNSNENNLFCLFLIPNGHNDEFRNNLSIFLYNSSPVNDNVRVQCKISIIGGNGEKINTKSLQCIFNENNRGFRDNISVSQLLDHSNEFLCDDRLTLLCEIQLIDFKMQHSRTKLDSIETLRHSILQLNQSLDSVHLSKCAHKWTIHNFACALADESSGDELVSCIFTYLETEDFEFYLSIFPKGYDKDSHNYVSAHLHVDLFQRTQLVFQYRLSLIDANENMLKTEGGEGNVGGSSCCIIDMFISHNNLHQYLNDNALKLYCEIDVIQNRDGTELARTKKVEYFRYLSKLELNTNEVTEITTNAKAKKFQFEYIWEIENCRRTSDTEPSSLFTCQPTSSYIESPPFSPPNHSTTNQHRFYLRMYPNGEDEECKDYVSMYLGVETFEKRQVACQFKISLIDFFQCKFNTQEIKGRYKNNDIRGLSKFISHFDLFNQTNALITENKLAIHCEVEFLNEENNEKNQIEIKDSEDTNPTNNSTGKLNQTFTSSLTPTQSITQVTLLTYHWTINNFNLYFQSIQDKSSYLESTRFSPANDDELQFFLRFYPKRNTNQLSIYYGMIYNRKQMPPARIFVSVLDENDRKCFTETLSIDSWNRFSRMNWKDIQLKPNSLNQLKLLLEYQLFTHYSSTTEMSHLDQFSLDHFTSPWQVKRLCHVPTHSRALTSIPVESCHFEWSIHDFSNQQGSMQSLPYRLGQLEFYLKMYSQQQNRILIYLCLKKSVEKEIKMCLKISILDKDGHKTDTKDVFKKLTNVELEYECTEFEINKDVIHEDGQLKMFCEFNLVEEPKCSSIFVALIPKVLPNLNALLTNCQKSDLVLQFSDGNRLHAHRSILSFRSPVFEKMFEHDTSEAQHGQVDITDMDMEVCELMLRYIYTGLVQLDQASTLDLMIAADKYQISELKTQCEDWLCANLSIESVTDCLVWSDQIGANKLKTKSIAFFHINSIAISQTNAIKKISKNRPDLMQELYLDLTRKFLNNKTETNLIEGEEDEDEEDISVL